MSMNLAYSDVTITRIVSSLSEEGGATARHLDTTQIICKETLKKRKRGRKKKIGRPTNRSRRAALERELQDIKFNDRRKWRPISRTRATPSTHIHTDIHTIIPA